MVGLTPLMGGTQRIAERAGPARAREVAMSGDLFDAATLERWNVINRVLPDDDLAEQSLAFAQRLAAGPAQAHRATKRIVRGADAETGAIGAPLVETDDLRRAVRASSAGVQARPHFGELSAFRRQPLVA